MDTDLLPSFMRPGRSGMQWFPTKALGIETLMEPIQHRLIGSLSAGQDFVHLHKSWPIASVAPYNPNYAPVHGNLSVILGLVKFVFK